jgi:hypothetical protein
MSTREDIDIHEFWEKLTVPVDMEVNGHANLVNDELLRRSMVIKDEKLLSKIIDFYNIPIDVGGTSFYITSLGDDAAQFLFDTAIKCNKKIKYQVIRQINIETPEYLEYIDIRDDNLENYFKLEIICKMKLESEDQVKELFTKLGVDESQYFWILSTLFYDTGDSVITGYLLYRLSQMDPLELISIHLCTTFYKDESSMSMDSMISEIRKIMPSSQKSARF